MAFIHFLVKVGQNDTGFQGSSKVIFIDLQDAVHLFQGQADAAVKRNSPAGQASTGTTRGDRNPVLVGEFENLRDLGSRSRLDDHLRRMAGDIFRLVLSIVLRLGTGDNIRLANDLS